MESIDRLDSTVRPITSAPPRLPTLAAMAVAVAILYFAKDVFLPLAIAVLLTFALAPIVAFLRRAGLPRLFAVITSVASGFLIVAVFSAVVAFQVSEVGQNISIYQYNIIEKIRTLKEASSDNSFIERLNRFAERIGTEINRPEQKTQALPSDQPEEKPLLVQIFAPRHPVETLRSIIEPLVGPLATTGLVVVVVIFMLLEREELRDRFIRLVGYGDLHRTTEALQDAGKRVGQYLLTQLVVNITYGVPLAFGLWILGIPNAALWGMLAIVLRFVPYIGPVMAAILPLFLAFAVAPGWSLLLWTIGLFVIIELLINNVIEPWLYGSRTGLSPLAIIVSAIFWTWLWGPVGLVLSTPLTVCLVVLGRHVPQFEFLEILFGNEPVLDPKERLYQRLLAGDPDEATDNAEEMLERKYLVEFYGSVAIPALLMAERDRLRGVLTEPQLQIVDESTKTLVANLEQIASEEEGDDEEIAIENPDGDVSASDLELPSGEGRSLLTFGGRKGLDDTAAIMLAQVLAVQGASAEAVVHDALKPANLRALDLSDRDTLIICFLDQQAARHARFAVRRLRRLRPSLRIGVVLWHDPSEARSVDREALREEMQADFVACTMIEAVVEGLSEIEPKPLKAAKKTVRARSRKMTAAKPA
ncbi:AI-2E family transporter [Brucella anthropi]|jgi:predicted PurR-regulated permease PerM|uniref:AI-2E family transporter n=1 Tax=Brucella anthropi TaxID=529 RepID=A0A011TGD7_BRUAN|nr:MULTISPECIES: AI-2E family transporter [Brucella/Ochrobactrum group]QTN02355.1 AI-2E family transporter [Ochrobactrum sp. EEELCW01]EXL02972.1 ABC transporter permease [Brucella anthropi]KAB2755212.1 AI-2E family transporter [Brucella anthropi]KAB2790896.1 AI-2E family transporter [Brucella anthropi]KAB2793080.1 AI-2E family transporter [Brucella anthropi]